VPGITGYMLFFCIIFGFIDSLAMSACSRTVQESALSGQFVAWFGSFHCSVWVCYDTYR